MKNDSFKRTALRPNEENWHLFMFIYSPCLITAWKCLLVKVKVKAIMHFHDSFFICYLAAHNQPWDIRGGSLTQPMFITAVCLCKTQRSPGDSWNSWIPKPGQTPSEVWTGNLPIHSPHLDLLGHYPQNT